MVQSVFSVTQTINQVWSQLSDRFKNKAREQARKNEIVTTLNQIVRNDDPAFEKAAKLIEKWADHLKKHAGLPRESPNGMGNLGMGWLEVRLRLLFAAETLRSRHGLVPDDVYGPLPTSLC
ncbi:MAG: hypothetical protein KDB22_15005 [Planctomycetales bacterium]|nr:hypothetical protein [Planctomycetales bacterium]